MVNVIFHVIASIDINIIDIYMDCLTFSNYRLDHGHIEKSIPAQPQHRILV
jgi:hypothetical protein